MSTQSAIAKLIPVTANAMISDSGTRVHQRFEAGLGTIVKRGTIRVYYSEREPAAYVQWDNGTRGWAILSTLHAPEACNCTDAERMLG